MVAVTPPWTLLAFAPILVAAGVLEPFESLLLPPQAATPAASASAQIPTRTKRCMRFTGAPLP